MRNCPRRDSGSNHFQVPMAQSNTAVVKTEPQSDSLNPRTHGYEFFGPPGAVRATQPCPWIQR